MPWKETDVMDLRISLIADYLSGNYKITDLARKYEVSRKTVYKWIGRFLTGSALGDRGRAPHTNSRAVADCTKKMIIAIKHMYPHLGPPKIMNHLRRVYPSHSWPADSTAGIILKQAGLVRSRRRRPKVASNPMPFSSCNSPNAVWSADYKGDFYLGNKTRCYPLTVSDNYSRFLLACQALTNTSFEQAKPVFERLFYEYGLPKSIRIDNGAPFASTAFGGLSRLSAWWIRLGICPERIEKGKPSQNGRHERMHRSLKEAAINPSRYSINAQQKAFCKYLFEYNHIRSHEALDDKVPADVYRPSNQAMPDKMPEIEYGSDYQVRKVRHNGEIKWQGNLIYLSQVFAKQPIAFKQLNETYWGIYYGFYLLGYWNEKKRKLEPIKPPKKESKQKSRSQSAAPSLPDASGRLGEDLN